VERPASIVKELIENSIDANANKIYVEVKEGGKSFIKVTDNGNGMDKKDAELSWQRHSTSKIKDAKDLFSINTLGFRGEALASIAAVSELTIITKQDNDISGNKIVVHGGTEVLNEEYGCPKGTSIEVKNLFFNTPARKKYMKSIEVEIRHITDIVTRYALIYPIIAFKLVHNKHVIVNSPSTEDKLANISFIYGNNVAKNLIEINYTEENIKVTGFVSKPVITRSTKADQSIYVNNRYIKKNQIITDAINNAYKTFVMVHRHPIVILNIELNVNNTDVNVHPQKAEIRIQNEKKLYNVVFNAVKNVLEETDLIPEALEIKQETLNIEISDEHKVEDAKQKLLVKETSVVKTTKFDLKILGIINKTYILAEVPGNLLLIDQHAAAERILYEKYTKELKNNNVFVQKLLNPEILELNPKQFNTAIDKKDFLANFGYQVEEFGVNTLIIRTIPIVLGKQFNKDIFIDYLDELNKGMPESLEQFFHDRIARMACRTAIKAGDDITLPQIKEYIKEIFTNEFPSTCPHGRPIVIKWTFYELEKMFKRVV